MSERQLISSRFRESTLTHPSGERRVPCLSRSLPIAVRGQTQFPNFGLVRFRKTLIPHVFRSFLPDQFHHGLELSFASLVSASSSSLSCSYSPPLLTSGTAHRRQLIRDSTRAPLSSSRASTLPKPSTLSRSSTRLYEAFDSRDDVLLRLYSTCQPTRV
jgi:hypothetical protein